MWFNVNPTLQMVLYNSQLQLEWNSILEAKPEHNPANVWTELLGPVA